MATTAVWVASNPPTWFQTYCLMQMFGEEFRLNHERSMRMCDCSEELAEFVNRYSTRCVVIAGDAEEIFARSLPITEKVFYIFHYPLALPIKEFPIRVFTVGGGVATEDIYSPGTNGHRVEITPGNIRSVPIARLWRLYSGRTEFAEYAFIL